MMHYIRGILIEKNIDSLILEVSNYLAYEIKVSRQTINSLAEIGSTVLLYTYLLIKEEKQILYGFSEREEKDLFQELLKINNIGPKAALTILSELNLKRLVQVVQNKEIIVLQKIPGIGRKTAERLLLEMHNRLEYLIQLSSTLKQVDHNAPDETANINAQKEAISALVALGYRQNIAYQVIQSLEEKHVLSTEALIRLGLQQLIKRA